MGGHSAGNRRTLGGRNGARRSAPRDEPRRRRRVVEDRGPRASRPVAGAPVAQRVDTTAEAIPGDFLADREPRLRNVRVGGGNVRAAALSYAR